MTMAKNLLEPSHSINILDSVLDLFLKSHNFTEFLPILEQVVRMNVTDVSKNYFSDVFENVWNIATGAGLRTHGCFWSSGSSRAYTRPCHQVGRGKYPQAKIFTNIHDDAGNCRKQMSQNNISLIKISRFNSVTGESERPSSLGPGFTAPPGGPDYLNRKVIDDEFCDIIES